jgi:hypothetical protein
MQILRDLDQENLVYSPFTLHTALSALKMAADGDTLSEISAAAGLNKLSNFFVQTGFMELMNSLRVSRIGNKTCSVDFFHKYRT